ncbi:MAG: transcriptional repressor LexA [Verrucomicrobiota bacterium]
MADLTVKQQRIVDFIRLRQEREGVTPTQAEIADHFGYGSRNAVAQHLRLIRQKGLLGETNGKARSIKVISPLQRFKQRIVDIPVFGSIPAGYGEDRVQEGEGCVSVDVESIGIKPTRNTFALRVTGDSMIGRHILDGDMVVMEHGPEPRHGEIVAALIDGKSTLKTFLVRNRRPYLKAENPKYPDLIPAEELLIQGVFRALIRKSKE